MLSQLRFLVLPGIFGAYAWRERCSSWLHEQSVPWEQGLVVSEHPVGRTAHHPWKWPEKDKEYFLRERSGWITVPLSTQFDMTSYWPGFMPRFIVGMALFSAAVVALTILSGSARWWRFGKWGRGVILFVVLGLVQRAVLAEHQNREAAAQRQRQRMGVGLWNLEYTVSPAMATLNAIAAQGELGTAIPVDEHLSRFADTVKCGDLPPATGEARRAALRDYTSRFFSPHRRLERTGHIIAPMPGHGRFALVILTEDTTDPPGAPATAAQTVIAAYGTVIPPRNFELDRIDHRTVPLWTAQPRPLHGEAASAWANAVFIALLDRVDPGHQSPSAAALLTTPGETVSTNTSDPLESLFAPLLLSGTFRGDPDPAVDPLSRSPLLVNLRTTASLGARPHLRRPPSPAQDQPGGRRRMVLELEDRGQPASWQVDLIFSDSRWQCVNLRFSDQPGR